MNGRTFLITVLALIVLGGIIWFFSGSSSAPAQNQAPAATTQTPAAGSAAVAYTSSGFSPAAITVPLGTSVTWTNQASDDLWVASGVHPAHALYDGTNLQTHCAAGYAGDAPFDECAPAGAGGSYSFTFTKAGTWQYHNHLDPGDTGTVVVTEASAAAPAPTGGSAPAGGANGY